MESQYRLHDVTEAQPSVRNREVASQCLLRRIRLLEESNRRLEQENNILKARNRLLWERLGQLHTDVARLSGHTAYLQARFAAELDRSLEYQQEAMATQLPLPEAEPVPLAHPVADPSKKPTTFAPGGPDIEPGDMEC